MADYRNALADRAFRRTFVTGIPITQTLQDNFRLGSFWVRVLVTINTTDTTITHQLGRIPSGYIVFRAQGGGYGVEDGSNDGSDWTSTAIVLRAKAAGTFTILIG